MPRESFLLSCQTHSCDIASTHESPLYCAMLTEIDRYADAVVGVPGEGLNVEQRKRLTIGVELAAKPELLLFLDEPTSGLDSQTSWAICDLMEKLTKNGQAVLCTVRRTSISALAVADMRRSINLRQCCSSDLIDCSSSRKAGKPFTLER